MQKYIQHDNTDMLSIELQSILIIDDYEMTRNIVEMFLVREGHEVDVTGTAKDGLEMAIQNHYSIILLDLNLPDESGLELAKQLRQHDALKNTKIIIFTGYDHHDINYYRQYGIDGLLIKPITPEKIIELINIPLLKEVN